MRKRRIGLLGGSFNPAHAGHLAISLDALKRFHLHAVWWLVSPGNPLKDPASLAEYDLRLASARRAATDRRIFVSDLERREGTRYTIDTLRRLAATHPHTDFVWLIGADNLAGFHRWRTWCEVARHVGLAVYDRAPWTHRALRSPAALRLASDRLPAADASRLTAGSWIYVFAPRHPASATVLRKALGAKAFLPHNQDSPTTERRAPFLPNPMAATICND